VLLLVVDVDIGVCCCGFVVVCVVVVSIELDSMLIFFSVVVHQAGVDAVV